MPLAEKGGVGKGATIPHVTFVRAVRSQGEVSGGTESRSRICTDAGGDGIFERRQRLPAETYNRIRGGDAAVMMVSFD